MSKSIVSRRLLRLETELGVQLLARTTRGAGLTEAGMTFREHAVRICAMPTTGSNRLKAAANQSQRRPCLPVRHWEDFIAIEVL